MKLINTFLVALVSANQNDPTAILDQLRDGCVEIIKSDAFGADAEWVTKWEAKDWVEPDTHKLQSCNILWSIVYVSFWQNSGQAIPTSTMKSVQDSASDWTRFIIDHQKRVHMVHVVKWWIHIKSSLISTKKNIHVKLSENSKTKWSDFQIPFSLTKKPA